MAYNIDDTICAVSTAPGVGGIAVVRVSGPEAIGIVDRIWKGRALEDCVSHTAHLGTVFDPDGAGEPLDQAVATLFRGPASFTGEDVVELAVHGSTFIQQELLNLLIRQGARMAEPGEFTRRAFANGRLDLAQAEAVADVIASTSAAAHRLAMSQMRGAFSGKLATLRNQLIEVASLLELELDFSEEDVEFADRKHMAELTQQTLDTVEHLAATFSTGDAIKRGIPVAIIGRPNAGKSSVLNRLLGDDRAIVSPIPGTTRDTIEDTATIKGTLYRFIDTAGLRHTSDIVESLGIDRTWQKASQASMIIWVVDAGEDVDSEELHEFLSRLTAEAPQATALLVLMNKSDVVDEERMKASENKIMTAISACGANMHMACMRFSAKHDNVASLNEQIAALSAKNDGATGDMVMVTNVRHYEALINAIEPLKRVLASLSPILSQAYALPLDLVAQDIREAIHHLSTITGEISTSDLLQTIFSRFCIGK